ncbi:hypothetical protein GCM10028798_35580 [Humibacter antri]
MNPLPVENPLALAILQRRAQAAYEIWDAHAHVGRFSRFFIPDHEPAHMVEVMDRAGVHVAVISALRALEDDTRAGNAEMVEVLDRWPTRFRGWVVFNPWLSTRADLLGGLTHPGVVGVKIHPDLHEYPVTGMRYEPMWRAAVERGVPVLTHTWATSPFDDPAMLAMVARRHPDLRILLGHSGASPAGFELSLELALEHPQLHLEICGSRYSGTVLSRTVAAIGADRVVFGSDFPFIDLRPALGRVAFADLTESDRRAVLGGTARHLLGARAVPTP